MRNNQNPPINFNPAYDLQQKQIQIIPEFTETEALKVLGIFEQADVLYDSILDDVYNDSVLDDSELNYPIQVHCIALPQFSSSCWLQGVSVQRIVDQAGIKPATTDVCLELTRTKDPLSGVMYVTVPSVIYLATRQSRYMKFDPVVIIDNILNHYAKRL